MQVVALVSQKGGAGKTTLAAGLAVSGEYAGLSTVLNAAPVQGPLANEALAALAGCDGERPRAEAEALAAAWASLPLKGNRP